MWQRRRNRSCVVPEIEARSGRDLKLPWLVRALSTKPGQFQVDRRLRQDAIVELEGMTIEVLALTEDQRASNARFLFDRDVDAERFHFYHWENARFAPLKLPRVGSSRQLPSFRLAPTRSRRPSASQPAAVLRSELTYQLGELLLQRRAVVKLHAARH